MNKVTKHHRGLHANIGFHFFRRKYVNKKKNTDKIILVNVILRLGRKW